MFAIRSVILYYLLFVIWFSLLFAIGYLVLHAQIIRITNSEYSITTHFLENISNFWKHSLTLFLSVLTQNFIFDQYKKLRKGNYQYVSIVLYVYIFLHKKW